MQENEKKIKNAHLCGYSGTISDLMNDPEYFGRMNDPTGAAYLKGICGDEMEFYLTIENDIITDARYYTEGCKSTKACGAMAAYLAKGKTIAEALSISAGKVIEGVKELPDFNLHCSILAVSTLYRAVADYLLKL